MFLSSSERDLGVVFKVHLGSLASSRVEAKNSVLLLSCHPYLLKPIEWPKGSQASCGVLRDCSLGPAGKEGPHLSMTGHSCGFFRAAEGRAVFPSNYNGELMEPLGWPQGSPIYIRVVRGSAALLSSHGREIGPQDVLKGES